LLISVRHLENDVFSMKISPTALPQ